MLDFCCDFVVNNCLLVFTNNVDAQFEVVCRLQFVWLRLSVFLRETGAVDKSTI